MVNLDDLTKEGYFCQMPSKTDKTFFFTRHINDRDEQLWIVLKKTPEIEYIVNYKPTKMSEKLVKLVSEFLGGMDYDSYVVLSE